MSQYVCTVGSLSNNVSSTQWLSDLSQWMIFFFVPEHPDLSTQLPKQVCLIIRGGSGSCQQWSECVTRGTLACWVQLLHHHHPLPMTRCTPGSLHTHVWLNTHLVQTHLSPLSGDRAPTRRSTRTAKINPKTNKPKVKRSKIEIQRCASAIYASFHLQFTFTQGRNLHFNFGGDIWELLKTQQL